MLWDTSFLFASNSSCSGDLLFKLFMLFITEVLWYGTPPEGGLVADFGRVDMFHDLSFSYLHDIIFLLVGIFPLSSWIDQES